MEAAQALADLVEISSQIEFAVLADGDGIVLASTFGDDARAGAIAEEARELLQGAAGPAGEPTQVEVAFHGAASSWSPTATGSWPPSPGATPAGLVFYDLKTCLRLSGEEQPAKATAGARRKRRRTTTSRRSPMKRRLATIAVAIGSLVGAAAPGAAARARRTAWTSTSPTVRW